LFFSRINHSLRLYHGSASGGGQGIGCSRPGRHSPMIKF
jgi:hypothetical protein